MTSKISHLKSLLVLCALVGSLFVFTSLASAQGRTGTIIGTVTDPTGAVIPGVKMTITEAATGIVHTVKTNSAGNYQLPYLPDGQYTVKAEHSGFQASVVSNVALVAQQTVRVNIQMKIGMVTQTTEVSASAIHLQTDTTVVGSTVQSNVVSQLPLVGRTFVQLAELVPGVDPVGSSSIGVRRHRGSLGDTAEITANGFSAAQNNYSYDGATAKDLDSYSYEFAPSIEAIQEFRVQTNTYSAEYGGEPGAQITVITKSGTNGFHGSAWEFNRNNDMAARNFFSPTVPRLNRNQFGANLGGPIKKNKAFFFFNWEAGRQIQGNPSSLLNVPPPAFRNGDFSSLLPNTVIIDPTTGLPFNNNVIPTTQIDPASTALLGFTPQPNLTSGSNNFLTRSFPLPTDEDQYIGRVDYNLNSTNTIFGRYVYDKLTTPNEGTVFGNDEVNNAATAQNYVVNWTHTFSPTLVSSVMFGWNHFFETQLFGTTDNSKYNIACGAMKLPLASCTALNYGPPNVSAGYSMFGVRSNGPRQRLNRTWSIDEKNSLQLGHHLLDFGGSFNRITWTFFESVYPRGIYGFDGYQTTPAGQTPTAANEFADFLLGLAHSVTLSPTPWNFRENSWWNNLYVQDYWRVRPNLTINAGLRWDVFTRPSEVNGHIANFLMNAAGGLLVSGGPIYPNSRPAGFPANLVYNDYADWGPRAGVAWTMRKGTVLRGGYGLYYSPEVTNSYTDSGLNAPYVVLLNTTLPENSPVLYSNLTAIQSLFSGGSTAGLGAYGVNPHLKDSRASDWNVTVEQRLPASMVLNVGYVGSHGGRLTDYYNANRAINPSLPGTPIVRPLSGFGTVNMANSIGWSNYNSLQVQLLRHVATGLTIMGAYTYAKALGSVDGGTFGGLDQTNAPQDVLNMNNSYSIQSFDIRHRSSVSVIYNLPFFQHGTGFQHQAFGGWTVNTIISDQTGFGNGVSYGADTSNTGVGSLPDMVANPTLPRSQRSINEWFNTAAFAPPAPGRFGTAPRLEFHNPGINTVDFMMGKTFFWGEGRTLVLRGEFFNLFNHTNFQDVDKSFTSNGFGTVVSALDPRIIQLGVKLSF